MKNRVQFSESAAPSSKTQDKNGWLIQTLLRTGIAKNVRDAKLLLLLMSIALLLSLLLPPLFKSDQDFTLPPEYEYSNLKTPPALTQPFHDKF